LSLPKSADPVAEPASFDRIAASLFISYIFNPDYLIEDFFRMLRPGGLLLVSSMRPDSDISVIFTDFVHEFGQDNLPDASPRSADLELQAARSMLNEAAGLFELEEEGYFKFYKREELMGLLETTGFCDLLCETALGDPSQAYIVTGRKPMV
jgi:SAM-dependent methyltransferase